MTISSGIGQVSRGTIKNENAKKKKKQVTDGGQQLGLLPPRDSLCGPEPRIGNSNDRTVGEILNVPPLD